MKTVIGLFDTFGEAQSAIEDLMRFGVRREDISLVARDEHGAATRERQVGSSGTAEGAGAGAVGGSLVGGALGLLVGTGLLVIPGIGPVLAAGPLAAGIGTLAAAAGATAIGAGLGAAAGGLLGGLMGAGVPEDEAQAYVEGVRRGGTLLTVQASDTEADDVREILLRNGAVDIDRRSGEWRAAGWGAQGADNSIDVPAADTPGIPRGDAYAIGGSAGAPAPGGDYRFHDAEGLGDADRKVVDSSFTDVDRTGERVKGSGYESGHDQPRAQDPAAFGEFRAEGEGNFRSGEDDRLSEGGRRSAQYAGADEMGGGVSNMRGGAGSSQPGRAASAPGAVRIYDSPGARRPAADDTALPAHGDFARGMRDEPASTAEPDFARGMHTEASTADQSADTPHHGDFARGMREDEATPRAPDFARGQRGHELYDDDYLAHYQSMTGAGGRPYDYYKPGYQFGQAMANDSAYSHDSWEAAERDARGSWERDARGSWEEFKDTIRYGWERARGRR